MIVRRRTERSIKRGEDEEENLMSEFMRGPSFWTS
jgi:hypothetical protein